jgi:hypothetical protein
VDGDATRVQRRDARGCKNDVAFVRAIGKTTQEGGLAGTGLAGEEHVAVRAVDELRREGGHFGLLMIHDRSVICEV